MAQFCLLHLSKLILTARDGAQGPELLQHVKCQNFNKNNDIWRYNNNSIESENGQKAESADEDFQVCSNK